MYVRKLFFFRKKILATMLPAGLFVHKIRENCEEIQVAAPEFHAE